ncbi:MAG TPA: carboxypeptidase regulatory-like domain-containing protein, partial [Erythrobacter sp.]|nr:carboxypeptidase regulatory-like domain-containing protein [Erythrobacter sp.]
MTGAETMIALLIGAGALVAAVRLLLLRRGWVAWGVAALSLASGVLLYLALFPPRLPIGGETLLVATAEAPRNVRAGPGERLVALPEAPAIVGAERVPDLATALRRHGQVQRIRIIGRGLTDRDRDNDIGMRADFTPMPTPRGLTRLEPPPDTPAGSVFALAGEAAGLEGGTAELLDPAGRRVDVRLIGAGGGFTLGGTARVPGFAQFILRLRGRDKAIVSDTPVALRTLPERPFRVLLIAAPSPEAKYLRRWAEDSGIALQSRLEAGGGVDLGGDGARLDATTLREADAVIIDDLLLAGLGSSARGALAQAVAGGLGVVVRMTSPATASTRDTWRGLGLQVGGGGEIATVALPPLAPDADLLATRRGPGSDDVPDDINAIDDPAPDLGRWIVRTGADFVPVVTDADGAMVSGWQQRQQGRVALWTVANSFALVLNGQADRYEQWWSETVSAVSRPDSLFRPEVAALVKAGERIAICGIAGSARVMAPDKSEVALAIDPDAGVRGCAAYWPSDPGIHTIAQEGRDGQQAFEFPVLPEAALPSIRAREIGEATVQWAAWQDVSAVGEAPEQR